MRKIIFGLVLFYLVPLALFAQKTIQVEDMMNFVYPRNLKVSPEGNRFVFTVRTADFEKSRWVSRLWYFDSMSKIPQQLTFGEIYISEPEWSPDGKWITFLSGDLDGGENADESSTIQLWALPSGPGQARCWTHLENGVEEYHWSKDGSFILLLSTIEESAANKERQEKLARLKFDEAVKDSVRQNKVFWRLDPVTQKTERIAELDPGVDGFAISHNGDWAVYQTNYTGEYNDEQKYDLWVVNMGTGEKQQLTNFPGPETDPKFSPDDQWVAYINQTTPDVEFAETDLARIRFAPTQSTVDTMTLTKDSNRSVIGYEWEPDGKSFLIQIADGMATALQRFAFAGKKNRYHILTSQDGNAEDPVINSKTQDVFYLWEDPAHLPEISVLKNGKNSILSNFSDQLKQFDYGTQKTFKWKSVDSTEIEGLLFLPPNFDPNKKYPLILTVHGGPYGRFTKSFMQSYYTQIYTSAGYVVLAPNPRGSSGYSDAFSEAIWYKAGGHMGGIDYQDIMAGVDAVVREGYIDEKRMGVIGGSYGGYMTNWIISQNNRFAAAVSEFGIFSLLTDWSNSWQPDWEKMYLGIYYWEKPINMDNPYIKYSPAFYVKNIRTPVLILHGTNDRYTNLANSQEMYQALHTLGRPVKFVVYPREHHGLGREPNHRRDVVHRAKKWFDSYLK